MDKASEVALLLFTTIVVPCSILLGIGLPEYALKIYTISFSPIFIVLTIVGLIMIVCQEEN